jgi:catechol 2,3-dioxygenase-like lactoylglutathione lyase family enzyme
MTPAVHHIAIEVTNVNRSREFLAAVFGLREIPRLTEGRSNHGGAWFRLGNLDLHLQERPKGSEKNGQHFALEVSNFDEVVSKAPAFGGKVEEAKRLEGFSKRCFLRDPDNNRIEVLQK